MTKLDNVLRSRDHFADKALWSHPVVFLVVRYRCQSWTIKRAKCKTIDAFQLWCWRRLLRVPWTARRSNQSILKEISPGCSSEGLIQTNTLATRCEKQTYRKRPWCWERLRAGGEGDGRGWDGWMASPTQRTWVWASSGRQWRTGRPGGLQLTGLQRVRHDLVTEQCNSSERGTFKNNF